MNPTDRGPETSAAPSGALRFGLWPVDGSSISFEEARRRLFDEQAALLPSAPAQVLVVGGDGEVPRLLAARGYSASVMLGDSLIEIQEGIWDAVWLEGPIHRFGSAEDIASLAHRLLKEHGVLIFADAMLYDPALRKEAPELSAADVVTGLYETGFSIAHRERAGTQVLPSHGHFFESIRNNPKGDHPETLIEECTKRRQWMESGRMGFEIIAARKEPVAVRSYRPGDEAPILEMFKEQFHGERTEAHFQWKYLESPFGGPCTSLVFSEDGRLLSHYAGYPLPFSNATGSGPETFFSCHVGDTMTRPEGRRMGLGPTSLLARCTFHFYAKYLEEHVPFGIGFNTGRIRTFGARYLKYGYLELMTVRTLAAGRLARKPSRLRARFSPYRVERVTTIDAEWDALFDRVNSAYGLLVKRDAAYLRWRYLSCPDKDYLLLSVRKRGKLIGWGIFLKSGNDLLWGDALFDPHERDGLKHLLAEAAAGAGLGQGARIKGWFPRRPAWWTRWLDRLGFEIQEEPNRIALCYVMFTHPEMQSTLKESYYYTWGDSDLF
jgi:hypothetical protein